MPAAFRVSETSVTGRASRVVRGVAVLCAGVFALAACGAGDAKDTAIDAPSSTAPAAGGGNRTAYPLKLDNCGTSITIDAAPKRAIALEQGVTEVLLSLGLGDRIAGTATWTDPLPENLRAANEKIPRLADNLPSFEAVLDKEPDFLAASFASSLATGGVAPREKFTGLGVPTYLDPADCEGKDNTGTGDGVRTEPLRLESVYREIRELAQVFDVRDRGEELVASLQGRVDRARGGVDASGVELLYWFANSEAPYLAGCCGAPGLITNELGAKNVFDDTKAEWPQVSWETVADRDPDVLVIGDLVRDWETAESAQKKIAFLESNPATRNLTAVREKRYVLMSGQAMNPSIRIVDGIERIAAALREFGLVT